jgi:hypothetical protein
MPFKLLGCPEASIEAHKTVIYDHLGKCDLFIWLLMTALKVLFKQIILINQNDG